MYTGVVNIYEAYFGVELNESVPSDFIYEANNVSIDSCKRKCEELSCDDFLWNPNNGSCKISRPGSRMSLAISLSSAFIYYWRNARQVEGQYDVQLVLLSIFHIKLYIM